MNINESYPNFSIISIDNNPLLEKTFRSSSNTKQNSPVPITKFFFKENIIQESKTVELVKEICYFLITKNIIFFERSLQKLIKLNDKKEDEKHICKLLDSKSESQSPAFKSISVLNQE